jgi:hypothetical protein
MSGFNQEQSTDPVARSSREADAILSNLRALRDQIVTAWRAKGVVLVHEEQAAPSSDHKFDPVETHNLVVFANGGGD